MCIITCSVIMLLPLTKYYLGFMTVVKSCEMIHKLGMCFANNLSLCKSQREQMPGSCSLRARDSLKGNVQLEHCSPGGSSRPGCRPCWSMCVSWGAGGTSQTSLAQCCPGTPLTPCCQGRGDVATKDSTEQSWPAGNTGWKL